jgi:tetratricopeptide (TPR) repeat protein
MAKPYLTLASICLSCCISWALLGPSPSNAQLADEAGRACDQAIVTLDDAIAACSAVIDSGSLTGRPLAEAYAQRGFHRTAKRRLTEAEADLDEAIKIDPDYAQAYANRANFWTVNHKFDRAMADAEQALRLDPNLASGHFVRASAELNLGQYDRAIADYTETLKLRPSASADVWHFRGVAFHARATTPTPSPTTTNF